MKSRIEKNNIMKKMFLFFLVFMAQINTAQKTYSVGTLEIINDGIYNTSFNSMGVSQMHMGYDGATGYVKFGAHTGGGQRENILYMRGSDGNVGIGTHLPSAILDVSTAISSQGIYNAQKWSTGNDDYNLTMQIIWNNNGINERFVQRHNGIDYNSLVFLQEMLG